MLSVLISVYRIRGNAPVGDLRGQAASCTLRGGRYGPERCDRRSRCVTPGIPAGQAMTKVMIARLSQPGIAACRPPRARVTG